MTLSELIKETKIDLTQIVLAIDQVSYLSHEFEITPKTFLNYSKQDFKLGDDRRLHKCSYKRKKGNRLPN